MISDRKVGLTIWKDKQICLASKVFGKESMDTEKIKDKDKPYVEVKRPNVVSKHNSSMGGVNLHDEGQ